MRKLCWIGLVLFAPLLYAETTLPNVLLILADDLGYGDLGCYNPDSRIRTPNLDRLAAEGLRFTDAHSPATVCTPTRYSLLTGRMAFRTGNSTVFTGIGGPNLIEKERLTLGSLLQKKGYATAMTGKWHVGLSFLDAEGKRVEKSNVDGIRQVDFTRAIPDAPIHRGFDQFFGTACCPTTDWLYAYIVGDRVPVPPSLTTVRDKSLFPQHALTEDFRAGLVAPDFKFEEIDLLFLEKSVAFLHSHVKQNRDKPFFLFHSMQAVHLPALPAKQFQGTSGFGPHGDFIQEMDWVVGELLKTLEQLGVAQNTLILFTSDNGPEVPTVRQMRREHQHDGARPWRGVKRDGWEGGHRIPFLVRWPGKVKPGTVSDQVFSLTDVFATLAAVCGEALPAEAAEDSYNFLPVFLGTQGPEPVRPYLLQQAFSGRALSIRRGPWKFLHHRGSGGNDYARNPELRDALDIGPDSDPESPGQLYNLSQDPREARNVYRQHPDVVNELRSLLEQSVARGRSRD